MMADSNLLLFCRTFLVFTVSCSVLVRGEHCHADQGETTCGHASNEDLVHYERFEDIPEEMVQRGHLKKLGSHRAAEGEVEVLPYMITSEDFYEHYVSRHKPVVIRGAAEHWPAKWKWTDEHLNGTYGRVPVNMETRDDDKWNIPGTRTMASFLKVYKSANLYLVHEVPPGMRDDVTMPHCLRCQEISDRFYISYFWMSNGGTSSSLHLDTDENLLTVIQGRKEITLISPKYSSDVYTDEARVWGVSEVNVSAVDLKKFPRIANLRFWKAYLEAGDALYLPQMWWHYVYSDRMRQQAVAMWWNSVPLQKNYPKESGLQSRRRANVAENAEDKPPSFARWLEEYIQWIDETVKDAGTRPSCSNQIRKMSEFPFETDNEEWRDELNRGRDFKEEEKLCVFDVHNPENPCDHPACRFDPEKSHFTLRREVDDSEGADNGREEEEEEDDDLVTMKLRCLRYVLHYCEQYEDRGCISELPQLLMKKTTDEIALLNSL